MKHTKLMLNLIIISFSSTFSSGCAQVGLSAIPQTREGYNKALSTSDNEQFLLNIVRIYFGQTPYFVNVDNMVTQSTLRTGTSGDSQLSNAATSTSTAGLFWSIGPVVEFTQTPTITYSPLQGTQFVSGMLTPIDLDKLGLLVQSGWSTSSVLKLTMDKIGSLNNQTTASMQQHNEFNTFVNTIDSLESADKINYGATRYNDQRALIIDIADDKSAVELSKILHLSKPYRQLVFSRAIINGSQTPENIIYVKTRSFFSMLSFLSHGVKKPDNQQITTTSMKLKPLTTDIGQENLLQNIFLILSSKKPPDIAAAQIIFNGKWYYIADDDASSKATLVLLRLIYSLQIGELKANLPLITIPVK